MNERIRELAEQAKKYVDDKWAKEGSPPYPEAHRLFLEQRDEKFAELIVRECAEVIFNTQVEFNEIDAMHKIRDNVKQHFGVEP